MAQEHADLRQAEGERVARRVAGAGVSGVDRLRRKRPPVDRGQNLAANRQRAHQRVHARPPVGGALEVDDESPGAPTLADSRKT